MEQPHIPVMLPEVLEYLSADGFEGKTFIDGTFGNGGYTRAILEQGANVLAVDRDPTAIANGQTLVDEMGGRLRLAHGPFSQLDEHAAAAGLERVDGVVLDIGVSSMQLDQAERGFSFRYDGPLDMRMALEGPSAADVVNSLDVKQLHRVIAALGEEKKAGSVARAIVSARGDAPITRTAQLASIVEKAVGVRPMDKIHPATRTFQALRIFVNRELEELAEALAAAERVLKEGGRLVVVVFHSLEDRIVKRFFRERAKTVSGGSRHLPQMEVPQPTLIEVTRKAVGASDAEAKVNPRSRSAKLRAAERTAETARDFDVAGLGVPIMPFSLTGLANSGANIGGRS